MKRGIASEKGIFSAVGQSWRDAIYRRQRWKGRKQSSASKNSLGLVFYSGKMTMFGPCWKAGSNLRKINMFKKALSDLTATESCGPFHCSLGQAELDVAVQP